MNTVTIRAVLWGTAPQIVAQNSARSKPEGCAWNQGPYESIWPIVIAFIAPQVIHSIECVCFPSTYACGQGSVFVLFYGHQIWTTAVMTVGSDQPLARKPASSTAEWSTPFLRIGAGTCRATSGRNMTAQRH